MALNYALTLQIFAKTNLNYNNSQCVTLDILALSEQLRSNYGSKPANPHFYHLF